MEGAPRPPSAVLPNAGGDGRHTGPQQTSDNPCRAPDTMLIDVLAYIIIAAAVGLTARYIWGQVNPGADSTRGCDGCGNDCGGKSCRGVERHLEIRGIPYQKTLKHVQLSCLDPLPDIGFNIVLKTGHFPGPNSRTARQTDLKGQEKLGTTRRTGGGPI